MDVGERRTCSKCGAEKHLSNYPTQQGYALSYCRECRNAQKREAYHKASNREERLAKQSDYGRRRWSALRTQVLSAYGGSCACCGETEQDFLCIDHIDGGGRQHRQEVGSQMYLWLRRQGYPEGFQVLCFNCNHAKERDGGCPHRRQGQRPTGAHPYAVVGSPPEHREWLIGDKTYPPDIHPTARLNAFVTVDSGLKVPTRIGANTFVMAHCHIGHDAWIGDNCELAPGTVIGGHAKLGHRVRCGVNVSVKPGVTIGEGARIGAGAVVVKDVPPGEIWAGNPARPLSKSGVGTSGQTVHKLAEA